MTKYWVQLIACCTVAFWETIAEFNVTCWDTPMYIPLHALAQGYCRNNLHWLHGDKTTIPYPQILVGLQLKMILTIDYPDDYSLD